MAREATAREVQVKHFLELNRKLHLEMSFYGPQYQGKTNKDRRKRVAALEICQPS